MIGNLSEVVTNLGGGGYGIDAFRSVAPVEVVLQPAKARAAARIPAKYFFCTALILDTPKAKVQMLELVSSLTLFFFALRRPPGPKIKTNIRTILHGTDLNPPAKNGTQAKANLRLQPAASGGRLQTF